MGEGVLCYVVLWCCSCVVLCCGVVVVLCGCTCSGQGVPVSIAPNPLLKGRNWPRLPSAVPATMGPTRGIG